MRVKQAAQMVSSNQAPSHIMKPHVLYFPIIIRLLTLLFVSCFFYIQNSSNLFAADSIAKSFSCYQSRGLFDDSYGGGIIIRYDNNIADSFKVTNQNSSQISIVYHDTGKGFFRVSWMSSSPLETEGSSLFDIRYNVNDEDADAIISITANAYGQDGKKITQAGSEESGLEIIQNSYTPAEDGETDTSDDGAVSLSDDVQEALDQLEDDPDDESAIYVSGSYQSEPDQSDPNKSDRNRSDEAESDQDSSGRDGSGPNNLNKKSLAQNSERGIKTNAAENLAARVQQDSNYGKTSSLEVSESDRTGRAGYNLTESVSGLNITTNSTAPVTPLHEVVLRGSGPHKILLVSVEGFISDQSGEHDFKQRPGMLQDIVSKLQKAQRDDSVKAVILKINSNGGSCTVSDILYNEILAYKQKSKVKVVALFMDAALSGGYYISLASDHIIAHPATITGFIKAVFTGATQNQKPSDPVQAILNRLSNQFAKLVTKHRKISAKQLTHIQNRQFVDAQEALKLRLIDQIGYLNHAVKKAKSLAKLPENSRLIAYRRSLYPGDNPYNTLSDRFNEQTNISGFYYLMKF